MNEQEQAEKLALWLDAPTGPPPEGIDPDVLAAVYALRPELAPAPHLTADQILSEVEAGPLATDPASNVVSFPTRTGLGWRPWASGGVMGALAAAAALLMVVQSDIDSAPSTLKKEVEAPSYSDFQRRGKPPDALDTLPSPPAEEEAAAAAAAPTGAEMPSDDAVSDEKDRAKPAPTSAPAKTRRNSVPTPDTTLDDQLLASKGGPAVADLPNAPEPAPARKGGAPPASPPPEPALMGAMDMDMAEDEPEALADAEAFPSTKTRAMRSAPRSTGYAADDAAPAPTALGGGATEGAIAPPNTLAGLRQMAAEGQPREAAARALAEVERNGAGAVSYAIEAVGWALDAGDSTLANQLLSAGLSLPNLSKKDVRRLERWREDPRLQR